MEFSLEGKAHKAENARSRESVTGPQRGKNDVLLYIYNLQSIYRSMKSYQFELTFAQRAPGDLRVLAI